MTEANSPTYAQGARDGQADTERISSCPPQQPTGPAPPYPAYPVMYTRGYDRHFDEGMRHTRTDQCQWRRKESQEKQRRSQDRKSG